MQINLLFFKKLALNNIERVFTQMIFTKQAWLFVALLVIASCTEEVCLGLREPLLGIRFNRINKWPNDSIVEIIEPVIKLNGQQLNTFTLRNTLFLPLNPIQPSIKFDWLYEKDSGSFTVFYRRKVKFVSESCGPIQFFEIDSVKTLGSFTQKRLVSLVDSQRVIHWVFHIPRSSALQAASPEEFR